MLRPANAVAFVFLCALGAGVAVADHDPDDRPPMAARDKLRIVVIDPRGPVKAGVETKFTIQIELEFGSAKEGVARVGFNVDSPTSSRMIDSRDLREGRQQFSFVVKVMPVDWADRGDFAVMVNMGPKTTASLWAPTAYVHKTIAVKR